MKEFQKGILDNDRVITENNVQKMGEVIALCAIKTVIVRGGKDLHNLYKGLLRDINRAENDMSRYSDGYEIAQEVMLFLCQHIGKRLDDVYYTKTGRKITIKRACFSVADRYLAKNFISPMLNTTSLNEQITTEFVFENTDDIKVRKLIVNTFIREVILYDDEIVINYNFTDNPERLKLTKEQVIKTEKEIETADNSAVSSLQGSYKFCHTAPKRSPPPAGFLLRWRRREPALPQDSERQRRKERSGKKYCGFSRSENGGVSRRAIRRASESLSRFRPPPPAPKTEKSRKA